MAAAFNIDLAEVVASASEIFWELRKSYPLSTQLQNEANLFPDQQEPVQENESALQKILR